MNKDSLVLIFNASLFAKSLVDQTLPMVRDAGNRSRKSATMYNEGAEWHSRSNGYTSKARFPNLEKDVGQHACNASAFRPDYTGDYFIVLKKVDEDDREFAIGESLSKELFLSNRADE